MAKKADKKVKKTNDDVELLQTSRKKTGKFEKAKPIKPKKRGNGLVIAICILIPVLLPWCKTPFFIVITCPIVT